MVPSRQGWVIHPCRSCHEYLVSKHANKTRTCTRCNHVNRLDKVRVLAQFATSREATDALRFMKIPEESRGDVPYLRGSAASTVVDMDTALDRLFKKLQIFHNDGFTEGVLEKEARAACLPIDPVLAELERRRREASIIKVKGGKYRFT